MAKTGDSLRFPVPTQSSENSARNFDELSYLPPPDPFYVQQGFKEKVIMKTKENPFVPLGAIFTAVVLSMGLWSMRSGSGRRAQILMRLRVGGQAFAVFAMLAGVYYKGKSSHSDK